MIFHPYSRHALVWTGIAGLLLIVVALTIYSRSEFAHRVPSTTPADDNLQPRAALTITVTNPITEYLPTELTANGNLEAWQEASIGAEVNGLRLAQVLANVGDVVKKGQVLALFARESTLAETLQSKANLALAQANYENAQAEAQRVRSIEESGAFSTSQIAQYLTAEKVQRAQFEAANAAYRASQIRLNHTTVVAPDDGVISQRLATVGSVMGSGQELFRLVRQSRLEWRAEVTANEVGRIALGQVATVTAPSGATINGKVRAISPSANHQTRHILVFVDLPKHPELKAGTYAQGRFSLGERKALTVPQSSIVVRDGFNFVFVLQANEQVSQRKIEVGRYAQQRVEVLNGLSAQEKIAVKGAGFLNDGDTVKVVN